jgi:hypothetical protein
MAKPPDMLQFIEMQWFTHGWRDLALDSDYSKHEQDTLSANEKAAIRDYVRRQEAEFSKKTGR